MKNTSCEKCNNHFFTAYNETKTTCPFCGHSFFISGQSMIRSFKRSPINRPCLLSGKDIKATVQALDISKGGLGIEAEPGLPVYKDEKVQIVMEDFDVNSAARVCWVTKQQNVLRAGLQFIAEEAA